VNDTLERRDMHPNNRRKLEALIVMTAVEMVVTESIPRKHKLGPFQATPIIKGNGCTSSNPIKEPWLRQ